MLIKTIILQTGIVLRYLGGIITLISTNNGYIVEKIKMQNH